MTKMLDGIGTSATRREDSRFIRGAGRYTDDLAAAGDPASPKWNAARELWTLNVGDPVRKAEATAEGRADERPRCAGC
mgnify:CR=1 FL=1